MSHLTKTEISLVIRLNIVTIVARSVRLLSAYIHARRRPRHSSVASSMMVWSTPCQTCRKRCFSSSAQRCASATDRLAARRCLVSYSHSAGLRWGLRTVLWPQIWWNESRYCLLLKTSYSVRFTKIRTCNFRRVVRQHTENVMEIYGFCCN